VTIYPGAEALIGAIEETATQRRTAQSIVRKTIVDQTVGQAKAAGFAETADVSERLENVSHRSGRLGTSFETATF
jgi:hypothetical protein